VASRGRRTACPVGAVAANTSAADSVTSTDNGPRVCRRGGGAWPTPEGGTSVFKKWRARQERERRDDRERKRQVYVRRLEEPSDEFWKRKRHARWDRFNQWTERNSWPQAILGLIVIVCTGLLIYFMIWAWFWVHVGG
jgi:polyferredoxin